MPKDYVHIVGSETSGSDSEELDSSRHDDGSCANRRYPLDVLEYSPVPNAFMANLYRMLHMSTDHMRRCVDIARVQPPPDADDSAESKLQYPHSARAILDGVKASESDPTLQGLRTAILDHSNWQDNNTLSHIMWWDGSGYAAFDFVQWGSRFLDTLEVMTRCHLIKRYDSPYPAETLSSWRHKLNAWGFSIVRQPQSVHLVVLARTDCEQCIFKEGCVTWQYFPYTRCPSHYKRQIRGTKARQRRKRTKTH